MTGIVRSPTFPRFQRKLFVLLVLSAMVVAVFWPVHRHEFLNLDDDRYVTENQQVTDGMNRESVLWAFSSTHASNWHPLTWLSHMLDVELFALDSGRHHLMNVLFHALSSALLFLILEGMTGALWGSALIAALFALHPLHVESVAWLSERKDVLSGLLWMLTMGAYLSYARKPGSVRYLTVLLSFSLGLMAKPMLVTLPLVLLLLDYWPLGRWHTGGVGSAITGGPSFRASAPFLVREKVPLLVLSLASSVMTYIAQERGGAVVSDGMYSLATRITNALVSYVRYILKALWPLDLAVYYPHPGGDLPRWQPVAAGIALGLVSFLVLRWGRRHGYLAVGWLWYLGTLVPVVGIVQVGEQAMADRYTYLPLIGLFLMTVWHLGNISVRRPSLKRVLAVFAVLTLVALAMISRVQVGYWRNNITLYQHAIDLNGGNYIAHNNLGVALFDGGETAEAEEHFTRAVEIKPIFVEALSNLGYALASRGENLEALPHLRKAVQIDPQYAKAYYNLGYVYVKMGRSAEAIPYLNKALSIDPKLSQARRLLWRAKSRPAP